MARNFLFDTTPYIDNRTEDAPSGDYVTHEELTETVTELEGLIDTASDTANDALGAVGDLSEIQIPSAYRETAAAAINYNRGSIEQFSEALTDVETSLGMPSSASETEDVWQAIESLRARVDVLER